MIPQPRDQTSVLCTKPIDPTRSYISTELYLWLVPLYLYIQSLIWRLVVISVAEVFSHPKLGKKDGDVVVLLLHCADPPLHSLK